MSVWVALVLGLIQGLTEFLPISSSGHLTLAEGLLGITEGNNFFNVLLHLATLLSVIVVFIDEIADLIKHPFGKKMRLLFVAMLPTIIIALAIKFLASELFKLTFLGFGFLISATLLLVTYTATKNQPQSLNTPNLEAISYKQALMIGISQGFTALPGITRSGTTICTGVLSGLSRTNALKFSFLLSIPVIIASMVLEVVSSGFSAPPIDFIACLVGSLSAFISSLLSLKFMMKLARKGKWIWFSIYLFALSFGVLIFTFAM